MSNSYDFSINGKNNTKGAFDQVNNDLKKTNGNLTRMYDNGTRKGRNFRQQIQQVGYQVQDFAVQVGGGQNAMLAFGQQGSQLAGAFGPGGAIFGAVIAIGSVLAANFIPALFNAGKATEDLTEKIRELVKASTLSESQARVLIKAEKDQIKEKEKLIKKSQEEIKQTKIGLANQDLIIANYDKESKVYKKLIKGREEAQAVIDKETASVELNKAAISDLNKDIELYTSLIAGESIPATLKQRDAIKEITDSLQSQVDLFGKNERQVAIYTATQNNATQEDIKRINALYDLIEAEKLALATAQQKSADEKRNEKVLDSVTSSLATQIMTLELGEEAAFAYNIAQRLNLETAEQIPPAIQAQINKLNELKGVQSEVGDGSFWENLREHIGNTSKDFDTMWGRSFDNFAGGIGDATASAIVEGQDFGETMKSIARGAIQEVISGLIAIGVKRVALGAIETAMTAKSTAETVAATTAIAATTTAAMAPAAAATSLATAGTNSVPAISGMTAAMAAALGIFALSSFDGGGYTGDGPRSGGLDGKGGRLAMIHPQEFITDFTKGQRMPGSGASINATFNVSGNVDDSTMKALERNQKKFIRMVNAAQGVPA